jgi:hypothetical protein
MKRNVKKIALNRETLRNLDSQELANAEGAVGSILCYPPTYGPSCYSACPTQPLTKTNCA